MRRSIAAVGASGLLVMLLLVAASPAGAATASAGTPDRVGRQLGGGWGLLVLTTADGESPFPARDLSILLCGLPPNLHTDAMAACEDIAAAGGDFDDLPGDPTIQACPMIWAPVTVTATGVWDGRSVRFQRTFANSCELAADTGAVFGS